MTQRLIGELEAGRLPSVQPWGRGGGASVGLSISVLNALFCNRAANLDTVSDLFGEDRYFCDNDKLWAHQHAAIAERREAYLADGWGEVILVLPDRLLSRLGA